MKIIYKISVILLCTFWMFATEVKAAEGNVSYVGGAEKFIFAPGTEFSPSDLFPDLKDVMPGDSITQRVVIKNHVKNHSDIKVYLRTGHAQEDSKEFLSQLNLKVSKASDTELFDLTTQQNTTLDDWIYIGLLHSGGETALDVTLEVPATLGNDFQDKVAYLDWEFQVEEIPVNESGIQTGDYSQVFFYGIVAIAATACVLNVLYRSKQQCKIKET